MDAEYTFSKKTKGLGLTLSCKKDGSMDLTKETTDYRHHIPLNKEEISTFEAMLAVWRDMEKTRIEEQNQAAQMRIIEEDEPNAE